jgi:hypothetical protein
VAAVLELANLAMAIEYQLWGRAANLNFLDLLQVTLSIYTVRVQFNFAHSAISAVSQHSTVG